MNDAQRALRNARLPERLAPLLEGRTEAELAASAQEVAADLGIRPAASEAVLLARKALKHAAFIRSLHGGDDK